MHHSTGYLVTAQVTLFHVAPGGIQHAYRGARNDVSGKPFNVHSCLSFISCAGTELSKWVSFFSALGRYAHFQTFYFIGSISFFKVSVSVSELAKDKTFPTGFISTHSRILNKGLCFLVSAHSLHARSQVWGRSLIQVHLIPCIPCIPCITAHAGMVAIGPLCHTVVTFPSLAGAAPCCPAGIVTW